MRWVFERLRKAGRSTSGALHKNARLLGRYAGSSQNDKPLREGLAAASGCTAVLLPLEVTSRMSYSAWAALGVMGALSLITLACSSATPEPLPTYTSVPTYTLYPTYTSVPTATPTPTPEPTASRMHPGLRTPTTAPRNSVRPTPTNLEVSGQREVEGTTDEGKAGSTSDRPRPTPINTLTPEEIPEGVSRALAQDAQMYTADQGVELSEAIRRLTLQDPIGKLGATLESNEADTLAEVSGFSTNQSTV